VVTTALDHPGARTAQQQRIGDDERENRYQRDQRDPQGGSDCADKPNPLSQLKAAADNTGTPLDYLNLYCCRDAAEMGDLTPLPRSLINE
jgi:hypothetical protein